MLQLNAQTLRQKREAILNQSLTEDYEECVKELEAFFGNEENLLKDFPQVVITSRYNKTKIRLSEELIKNGFTVEDGFQNLITVSLYSDNASSVSTIENATVTTSVINSEPVVNITVEEQQPVVVETPKEEPKVVVRQPTYDHTNLQMSGDPF